MAEFFQVPFKLPLRVEARKSSGSGVPEVVVTPTDKLEIIGAEITEQIGALITKWVKVKCEKGDGFADRKLLTPFVPIAPLPDEDLPVELRRAIELQVLAEFCYSNALLYGSNSSLLLALARCASGSEWTATTAKAKDSGDRIGIYGLTHAHWESALAKLGPAAGIDVSEIASSRAQCEVAGFLTGLDWKAFEASRTEVRAIDLYVSFLVGVDVAKKIMAAADGTVLSAILQPQELAPALVALQFALPQAGILESTSKKALVLRLVEKLNVALEFVRAFAESLVADTVPAPEQPVAKTEQEIHQEDPTAGSDVTLSPTGPSVTPTVQPPPPQPGDGSMLLSEAHLVALWRRSLYPIDGRGFIVFGIRGCLPVDASGTGFAASHKVTLENIDYRKMRCTIGQWLPGKGMALFPGSTVPYLKFVEAAVPKRGAEVNQLGRGRYRNYIPGWHKRSEGEKDGHRALLQDSDTTFQRTFDDADYDPEDKWNVGRPGDNIHCAFHMGVDANIPDSRFSSAGCQVVAGTVVKGQKGSESGPWKKFIAPFLGNSAQKGVEYVLFDGREIQQMILTELAGKTVVLRMGSEGELVKQLQQRLAQRLGITIKVDGRFDVQTFQAVIDFQQQNFGKNADDGLVGPETAEKLGMTLPPFNFADAMSGQPGPSLAAMPVITVAPATTGAATTLVPGSLLSRDLFERFTPPPKDAGKKEIYDSYVDFFTSKACQEMLGKFQISASKKRLAHFFAQAAHETGGFALLRESLTYTTVGAVRQAWPTRAGQVSDEFIKDNLLRKPVELGDWAYGGRMGNVKGTSDGFDYRGGGTFQTTGRSAYREKGKLAKVDLEGDPGLVEKPEISALAACAEWDSFNGNALADADLIKKISRAINIGNPNSTSKANGEDERIDLFAKLVGLLI